MTTTEMTPSKPEAIRFRTAAGWRMWAAMQRAAAEVAAWPAWRRRMAGLPESPNVDAPGTLTTEQGEK